MKSAVFSDNKNILLFENWQYLPYKPGVPAPLPYPPGYQYSDQWRFGSSDVPLLPMAQDLPGSHHYSLDKSFATAKGVHATDGYSHYLHTDLSIHIWRHYKTFVFDNGVEVVSPDFVE